MEISTVRSRGRLAIALIKQNRKSNALLLMEISTVRSRGRLAIALIKQNRKSNALLTFYASLKKRRAFCSTASQSADSSIPRAWAMNL